MTEETKDKAPSLREAERKSAIEKRTADAELKRQKAEAQRLENERKKRVAEEKKALEEIKKARAKTEAKAGVKNKEIQAVHVSIENETVKRAENLVKMVANPKTSFLGCMLIGPAGMGKTHTVDRILNDAKAKYTQYNGHMSLSGIYTFLWENHNRLIFLDDVSQVVQHTEIMELLKAAMNTGCKQRVLQYRSKGVLDASTPKKFNFEGRIIMAFNVIDKNNGNVKAIMSRAPCTEFKYTYDEIIEAMYKIADHKDIFPSLNMAEKTIVVKEIQDYTDSSMDVDLRKLVLLRFDFFKNFKTAHGAGNSEWKGMVHNLFGRKQESWLKTLIRKMAGEGKIKRCVLDKEIAIRKDMSPRNARRKIAEYIDVGEIFSDGKKQDGYVSIKNHWK